MSQPDSSLRTPPRLATSLADRLGAAWGASWRSAVLLGLLLAVWIYVTAEEFVKPYLIPPPSDVAAEFGNRGELMFERSMGTLYATSLGFVWATGLGLLTAILIVYSRTMERTLYPLILIAQVIPKIAIAPILLVWFGLGMTPNIMLAVLISFFPVVISGVVGLRSVDPEHLDLAATMGASRLETFLKVRFPASLPHLFSGLKVAITLAVVGAIVGEFVGAGQGLGTLILVASGGLDGSLLFATLLCMGAIGIALFALVEVAERLVMPWHSSRRLDLVTA